MNKGFKSGLKLVAFLFAAACALGLAAQPLAAQVTIPQGSTVNTALFSVYTPYITNQTVYLHRITADWGELSVNWTNFADHYDATIAGSFVTDSLGWRSVDLTPLVQTWVSGGYPNYGIVMMQDPNTLAIAYLSSEAIDPSLRPKLEITYTTPAGAVHAIVIQRPGSVADGVADTWITQLYPGMNNGTDPTLITGNINGYEKFSLIRFHFDVIPTGPGTGTPGYWMNHPEAWPVPAITIGGRTYLMEEAIAFMRASVVGDKTLTMFPALVAAKLNVLIGNDATCISGTITAADAWMALYPVGSNVIAGKRSPWGVGEPLYLMLDNYNNGLLCAPHRD
jgi:hypothetical protein